jgi:hypothetical protein
VEVPTASLGRAIFIDKGRLPLQEWASQTVRLFVRRVEETTQLLAVSRAAMEALAQRVDPEGDEAILVTVARDFVDEDFPLLHSWSCLWLWTCVEAVVEDVLLGVLANDPDAIGLEQI